MATKRLATRVVREGHTRRARLSIGKTVEMAQVILYLRQRLGEPRLRHAEREVTARLLQDAACSVGRATQVPGDRVGEVEGNEQAVNFIHIL